MKPSPRSARARNPEDPAPRVLVLPFLLPQTACARIGRSPTWSRTIWWPRTCFWWACGADPARQAHQKQVRGHQIVLDQVGDLPILAHAVCGSKNGSTRTRGAGSSGFRARADLGDGFMKGINLLCPAGVGQLAEVCFNNGR